MLSVQQPEYMSAPFNACLALLAESAESNVLELKKYSKIKRHISILHENNCKIVFHI